MRIYARRTARSFNNERTETGAPSLAERTVASKHDRAKGDMPMREKIGDDRGASAGHDLASVPITGGAASSAPLQRRSIKGGSRSSGARSHGATLPGAIRSRMERAFGADFSSVRIHADSRQADDVGAVAYTQGNAIHFRPRAFQPHTTTGQKLLGHELAHIVQQREGRVAPTMRVNGRPVNDSPTLEREADEMGTRAAAGERVAPKSSHAGTPVAASDSMPMQGGWVVIQGSGENANLKRVKIGGKDLYQRSSDGALFEEVSTTSIGRPIVKPYVSAKPATTTTTPGGYSFAKAVDDRYEDYKKKGPTDWESDIRSTLVKNANLSDDESEPDTEDEVDHHIKSLDALFSVRESASDPTLTSLETTADHVKEELEDTTRAPKHNRLTRSTFREVAEAQTLNERLRIPNNSVLRPAYRRAIEGVGSSGLATSKKAFRSDGTVDPTKLTQKGKKLSVGEELYDTLRKKIGDEIPGVLEEKHQHFKSGKFNKGAQKGKFKKELKKKPYYGEYKTLRGAKRASLASKGGRSFALHHNHNKGGDDGFPEGALSPYNLTVENDDRKGRGDVHQAHHRITSGYGGKSVNYGVYRHEAGVAQIPAIEAPSIKPKRKATAPLKKGPPAKKRKIDRL